MTEGNKEKKGEKKKVTRYTPEEFAKLPKAEQERITKERKERAEAIKQKANESIETIFSDSDSDREKKAKFEKVYTAIRDGLLILKARKTAKMPIDNILEDTAKLLTEGLENL